MMTPELEDKYRELLEAAARIENQRMRERMGGNLAHSALVHREERQATGRLGGRPKMPKIITDKVKLDKMRKQKELFALKRQVAELEKFLKED